MQLLRLRGRKICDKVLRQGKVWKGNTMVIRWVLGAPRHPAVNPAANAVYIGTLASAKLDKSAVNRNRMRRRCREAVRLFLKEGNDTVSGTMQLLIAPRSSSLKAPFAQLEQDVRGFFSSRSHGSTATSR